MFRAWLAVLAGLVLTACGSDGPNEMPDASRETSHDASRETSPSRQTNRQSDAGTQIRDASRDTFSSTTPIPQDSGSDRSVPECSQTSLICGTQRPFPPTMKEAGLFPSAPNLQVRPASLRFYRPNWELWSDGLTKERYILLPAGGKIDISDREKWVPPVGTLFIKNFLSDGPNSTKRPVETRIIRRTSDPDPEREYEFAVYRWNDTGTDATLIDLTDRMPVPVNVGSQSFTHEIPSRLDCGKCHASNDTTVIGFDELRLNSMLPGSQKTQLEEFAAAGMFNSALPANPVQITDTNPVQQSVKGFIHGNCAHCHNGIDPGVFDMRYPVFVQNTVRKRTMGSGTAAGIRVNPGVPDTSILFLQLTRVMGRPGINAMPPVGVDHADPEAVDLVRRWILSVK